MTDVLFLSETSVRSSSFEGVGRSLTIFVVVSKPLLISNSVLC